MSNSSTNLKKSLLAIAITAVAGAGLSGVAKAADDSATTWNGVTLYGVYDIGLAYQTHGAPLSQDFYPGLQYMLGKSSNKSITSVAPSGLSQSRVGLRGLEPIDDEFSFIFNLEIGFNPQSGKLADAPKSLINNNGVALANQKSGGDGSRAGQLFNGQANAGFSSKDYGTVTVGRNNSVLLDNIVKYDPMNASYAFSIIGYSGVTAGMGDTEDARLDDSVKYVYKYDMFHLGALYQFAHSDSSPGEAYQGNLGFDYGGFSVDGVLAHKKDALSLGALSAAQVLTLPLNSLTATVSDNTSYTLDASYTAGPFKASGGYEHIQYKNPTDPLAAGFAGLGGYWIAVTNNAAFPHTKDLDVSWIGVKYLLEANTDVTVAWYHYDQNAYGAVKCSNNSAGNCSGTENVYSARVDHRMNKRFDVYAGIASSKVADGLANGYLQKQTMDPMVGVRFQF